VIINSNPETVSTDDDELELLDEDKEPELLLELTAKPLDEDELEDELELLLDEELELEEELVDEELELVLVEDEVELLLEDEPDEDEEDELTKAPDEELLELTTAPLLDELELGSGPCWLLPEDELLLEFEELLELLELLGRGLVLPVELLELDELELELELELEDGFTSFGFEEPPLPQATKDVVRSANHNDLESADRLKAISPPG
jgi:hypothetical protein